MGRKKGGGIMDKILERLVDFQYGADRAEFMRVFGNSTGAYLWGKYTYHKSSEYLNIISLYSVLDTANRGALATYLQFKKGE